MLCFAVILAPLFPHSRSPSLTARALPLALTDSINTANPVRTATLPSTYGAQRKLQNTEDSGSETFQKRLFGMVPDRGRRNDKTSLSK
jgi:hypothetical protein